MAEKRPIDFRLKLLLVSAGSVLLLNACGYGERQISVENCGEPIVVDGCSWRGQLFHCDITNNASEPYRGTPIWRYDADGNLLETTPYRYGAGIPAGETRRQKLPVTKYNQDTTTRIVFCRNQPSAGAVEVTQ